MDNEFVDIGQRQAEDNGYDYDEKFVCCKEEEVLLNTECPQPTDVYVFPVLSHSNIIHNYLTPFYSLDYFSNIFLSNFSCVPSYQCLGGGESVDLRQEATTCGFFIRQDKGNVDLRAEEVDLRSTKIDLRQSRKRVSLRQDSEYYDDYYEYDEDSNLICCNQENYIKPVDDCSDQEDHVYV